jgi:hypothetical protein
MEAQSRETSKAGQMFKNPFVGSIMHGGIRHATLVEIIKRFLNPSA